MIEVDNVTKRYGDKTAVDGVSFTVSPGKVTGFLGPNGAGKSTTMRLIMGLDRPDSGRALVNGGSYDQLTSPLTTVGALLDAKAMHKGRSAVNHLLSLAATHGIPKRRVNEVIELTGLQPVAKKRVGGFSLGMGQRLGIATALLGDPEILIFDEPVNGLDPEGVVWVRNLAKGLASEGRTVFLSSHLMSEVALTADHVIIIGRGKIIADAPIDQIVNGTAHRRSRVRSPQLPRLVELLSRPGISVADGASGELEVTGLSAAEVGDLAFANQVPLHELTDVGSTLESAYMELTQDSVEYRTGAANGPAGHNVAAAQQPASQGGQR